MTITDLTISLAHDDEQNLTVANPCSTSDNPLFAVIGAVASDHIESAHLLAHCLYELTENRVVTIDSMLTGLQLVQDDPRAEFLIARDNSGKIVGCIIAAGHEISDSRGGYSLKITALVVDPVSKGHGVARILHDTIISRAKVNGYIALTLDVHRTNIDGEIFWKHLGYKQSDYVSMFLPLL